MFRLWRRWPVPPLGTLARSHCDHLIWQRVAAREATKASLCDCLKLAEQLRVRSKGRVLTDVHSGERCAGDRAAPPVVVVVVATASGRVRVIVAVPVDRDAVWWVTLPHGVVLGSVLVLGAVLLQFLTEALAEVTARALESMSVVVLRKHVLFHSFLQVILK